MISRRGFLSGLGSMLAAPAIVHAGNLMPVRTIPVVGLWAPVEGMKSQVHSGVLTADHIRAIVEIMRERTIPEWPPGYVAIPFINGTARVPAGARFSHVEVNLPAAPGLGSITVR